jgi:hypothetical protein
VHQHVVPIAQACDGCLNGSYPEISTTARFYSAMFDHAKILLAGTAMPKPWPLTADDMMTIADEIVRDHPVPEEMLPATTQ